MIPGSLLVNIFNLVRDKVNISMKHVYRGTFVLPDTDLSNVFFV